MMSQVNSELTLAPTVRINLGDGIVRTLAAKPSGTIKMSDLWGKSSAPPYTLAFTGTTISVETSGPGAAPSGGSGTNTFINLNFLSNGTISVDSNSDAWLSSMSWCTPTAATNGSKNELRYQLTSITNALDLKFWYSGVSYAASPLGQWSSWMPITNTLAFTSNSNGGYITANVEIRDKTTLNTISNQIMIMIYSY